MHPRAAPQFPQAGIGLVEAAHGLFAERLQTPEQALVAAPRQALVEEDVRGGQDRRAVDVVLDLPIGLVADAHRPHAAVAGQRSHGALLEHRAAVDAVDRLQAARRRPPAATLTM